MGFLTSSTVLLLLFMAVGAVVHQFPARHLSRSKNHAELFEAMRNNPLGPRHALRAQRTAVEHADLSLGERPLVGSFPIKYGKDVFAADITIGTPPQTLTVEIDPYYSTILGVIGSAADLRLVTTSVPKKVYNSSASSTYTSVPGNFSDYGGRGHWGNDLVNLGGINVNLTFGIDDMLNSWYDEEPIDGILGLSPRGDGTATENSVLQQLLSPVQQVDQPLVTIWTNLSKAWNDSAQVTLGSTDPDHCESDSWTFGTEINSEYELNVTSAVAQVNGSDLAVDLGTRTVYLSSHSYFYVPHILEKLLAAATNATWCPAYHIWLLSDDIDISSIPPVRLDVVGGSNPLVLIPTDYIAYWKYKDAYYLNLYSYDDHSPYMIYVPYEFHRNHCIAYNFKDKTVGVGKSKWPLEDPEDF